MLQHGELNDNKRCATSKQGRHATRVNGSISDDHGGLSLTRFVMPREHWDRALAGSGRAQARHHVTRSVRERMVKLERAGLVNICADAYSRAAYEVTSVGARFAELFAALG